MPPAINPSTGYLHETLQSSEQIHAIGRIHWAAIIPSFIMAAISFAILWALLDLLTVLNHYPASAVVLVLPVFISISGLLQRETTEAGITNQRVLLKTGLLARRIDEISLGRIESTSIRQGLFGRLFGYGTLVVKGTGGQGLTIRGLQDPLAFREVLQQLGMKG